MSYPGLPEKNTGYLGLDYGPIGLWNLGTSLSDLSGNGFNMTIEAGTERYSDVSPGLRGFYFDGATTLIRNSADAALLIQGDMTLEVVCSNYKIGLVSSIADIVGHSAGTGETSAANYAYWLESAGTVISVGHEHGSGVDDTFVSSYALVAGAPSHVAFTRISNVYQVYLNGLPAGAPSSTLTTPDGGTSGRLRFGSTASLGFPWVGVLASVKILNKVLSSDQIRLEYNRTLGPVCGFR